MGALQALVEYGDRIDEISSTSTYPDLFYVWVS
jgi:hypothetical protein